MIIKAKTMNELIKTGVQELLDNGIPIESRAGKTIELINVDLELLNPLDRYLFIKGRHSSIYASMGETFWVLGSKKGKLDPVMNFFLPK